MIQSHQLPVETWLTKVCNTSGFFLFLGANRLPGTSLADPQASLDYDPQTGPSIGDIKIEYHPHSGRPPEILSLKDYQERRRKIDTPKLDTQRPWKPFQTWADFEFAEVALKAGLTKNQADTLISLMKRCLSGEETFNLNSHAHLCEIWNDGAVLHTAVSTSRIVKTLLILW